MKFDADQRSQVYADVTVSINPAGSTVELQVDAAWHAATWQGAAVTGTDDHGRPQWTQTALTTPFFAGPSVAAGSIAGATVLALGRHPTQTRVTKGGDIIPKNTEAIDVR